MKKTMKMNPVGITLKELADLLLLIEDVREKKERSFFDNTGKPDRLLNACRVIEKALPFLYAKEEADHD